MHRLKSAVYTLHLYVWAGLNVFFVAVHGDYFGTWMFIFFY